MNNTKPSNVFVQKLEEYEQKYGLDWVIKTFSKPPDKGNKFYDWNMKMHLAFMKRIKKRDNLQLSALLLNSLSGYNGTTKGRKCNTPETFYDKWLTRKTNQAKAGNKKAQTIATEGEKEKKLVIMAIARLIGNRGKGKELRMKSIIKPIRKIKQKVFTANTATEKIAKAAKEKKVIPTTENEEEPSKDLDIYYTDGGTLNNGTSKQQSTICVVKNGKVLIDQKIGNKTNNEAEYYALIEALKDISKDKKEAIIYSDSQLLVATVLNIWKTKSEHLIPLREEAQALLTENTKLFWLPRERNKAGHYLEEKYKI